MVNAVMPLLSRIAAIFLVLVGCTGLLAAQSPEALLRREAVARERLRMDRFAHQAEAGLLKVGATYTGRTVLAAARSVYVRNHLVVEVLVEPPDASGIDLNLGLLQLRVNWEKQPRMAQTPELVSYYIRTLQDAERGRLQAYAGIGSGTVVLDTGGQERARFPGDPRTPRPPRHERQETKVQKDALGEEAELVSDQAFRGGIIFEPVAGFLYFPCDLDLRKISKLELLVFREGQDEPAAVLKLK